ncbi:nucleotidyltransferase domain-containing protein [Bradyrhizobium diazoefficiens]|nr:nucleotidyltransferase domain-containing protein [Bradyrhizobium diazoefficiens]UCF55230.1 MAG: nucleotidyltransferase domain-containing protein [Bradyrhizobium sp.]MBR0979080.1 nucleotidyltransferase domain-containing protein [Bradyrhizobium diazoefficiens]MBR1010139.1 nucleotidyltransferase domain-containing protein [Bradyrhizobium diazoefficiens]MBR1017367.1 nucleotidyltransferase domain-containing protein [Bradyrhizobium diazoefficiens]
MSEQDYLNAILVRELVGTGLASPALFVPGVIRPIIEQWAGRYLLDVTASGSYAKGTANRSGTDLDLFISLSPETGETLSEIHKTLVVALKSAGYQPRLQNVSIGIRVNGYAVDLVPGKRQNWLFNDHSLYKRRGDTWTKTDISQHITKVKNSGRQAEIRLTKLWRTQKGLEFPSFYLELAVIKALETAWLTPLADNMRTVFTYLRDDLSTARFMDPSNTNNVISDDLTIAEKQAIKKAAASSLIAPYWRDIVI